MGTKYIDGNIVPKQDDTNDLGDDNHRFGEVHTMFISNTTREIDLNDIAEKGQGLVASGAFLIGKITVSPSVLTDGMYFFTYGNCQAFVYINSTMLESSNQSPIRVAMPVIYDAQGSSRIGTLGIKKTSNTTVEIKLVDNQGSPVLDNYTLYIFKTKLA